MKYLSRRQVAQQYPIKYSHLAHMACENRGPAYAIVGRTAVYTRQDVEDWLDRQKIAHSEKPLSKRKRGRPRKTSARQSG